MENQPTPDGILQLGLGFWGSKTLLSAVELGLFTKLAEGPLDVGGLAQRLGLHQRGARDFFDTLVALGMLRREGERYANAPETGLFLDRAKPSYIGGILEMANARLYGFWGSLTEALRTGRPQNEAKTGGNAFDAIYSDPVRLEGFVRSMTGISMAANVAIAQKFPWANYQSFIDVGTAQGGLAVQIALAQDHLSGGGFDLPVVAPIFEKYVASFGLAQRLSFYPGDFFKDQMPETDVLLMGHILHDWSMDEKRMLIAEAYDALKPEGALIVYDAIIDDDRSQNAFGLLMSLNMLIETQAGFDYTGAECQSWLRDAGFHDTYVEHLVGPDSMVVGIK
jgi:hypothetical protein